MDSGTDLCRLYLWTANSTCLAVRVDRSLPDTHPYIASTSSQTSVLWTQAPAFSVRLVMYHIESLQSAMDLRSLGPPEQFSEDRPMNNRNSHENIVCMHPRTFR